MRILLLTGMYPNLNNPLNGKIVEAQRDALESLGVKTGLVHIRPQGRTEFLHSFIRLRRSLRISGYDLVHAHYGFSALILSLMQKLPVVITFHGTDINGASFMSGRGLRQLRQLLFSVVAQLNRQLARGANAVIVMTQEMKDCLPLSVQAKTWIEPMGVDTRIFFQHPKQIAREKLGWSNDLVVAFCNNNDEPLKRQDLAEAAVAIAVKTLPTLKLFILKGIAREKVPWILSAADCLLVTSDKEGSPNIVRESLACNLPLVSLPVGDVEQLLLNHPSAGILTARDPESIARGIVEVLRRKRPEKLDHIIQENTIFANVQRIKEIYEQSLNMHKFKKYK